MKIIRFTTFAIVFFLLTSVDLIQAQTKTEKICSLEKVDAEDWFTVSKVIQHDEEGELGLFEVEGETFKILKAAKCKCPRCWKYRSKSEEDLCHRCNEALNA